MSNLKSYITFVKPYWKLITITLLIGMVKFGIPLTLPLVLKYVVDNLLLNHRLPASDKINQLFMIIMGAFVVFVVLRWPVEYYRQYFAQLTSNKILFDMRNRLHDHLQKLSVRFFQNRKTGELISRFVHDAEQTKNLVEVGMMNIWLDLFTLSIAIGIMFYLNPVLTLVAISIFPLYGLAVKILYKRLKDLTKSRSQALAEIQAYLHERIQGIPIIRSFTLENVEKTNFQGKNCHFLARAIAHTRWNALTFAIINTLTDIAPLLVIAYGGYQAIQGNLTIGAFVAFFGYLERLYSPLRRLVNSSTVLTQAIASYERVQEFLHEPSDIREAPDATLLRHPQGHIEYRDVWFRYSEQTDWVLKQIDLAIRPGETIALVGMSGGGKSSLVSLLPRFYDIEHGSIKIDGKDIRRLNIRSLRQEIGMVLQDNILFSGTVRENIMMGNPDASPDEMEAAAMNANAHDFISELPHGYDTEIGERGVKLSGGQKQRIAIARVFLKDPQILILDEATSALDLQSEALIQASLERLSKNRTTLIVAHRLSTITHADQIVVVEDGEIVEKGTHAELMQRNGVHARLYKVQHFA